MFSCSQWRYSDFYKERSGAEDYVLCRNSIGAVIASSQFYHFKRTKELLHQTGFKQKYRVGFDGGTEKFGYSFGGSMSKRYGNSDKGR
jgi:hypothetical protein